VMDLTLLLLSANLTKFVNPLIFIKHYQYYKKLWCNEVDPMDLMAILAGSAPAHAVRCIRWLPLRWLFYGLAT